MYSLRCHQDAYGPAFLCVHISPEARALPPNLASHIRVTDSFVNWPNVPKSYHAICMNHGMANRVHNSITKGLVNKIVVDTGIYECQFTDKIR